MQRPPTVKIAIFWLLSNWIIFVVIFYICMLMAYSFSYCLLLPDCDAYIMDVKCVCACVCVCVYAHVSMCMLLSCAYLSVYCPLLFLVGCCLFRFPLVRSMEVTV